MDISIAFDTTGYAGRSLFYRMNGLLLSRCIHCRNRNDEAIHLDRTTPVSVSILYGPWRSKVLSVPMLEGETVGGVAIRIWHPYFYRETFDRNLNKYLCKESDRKCHKNGEQEE